MGCSLGSPPLCVLHAVNRRVPWNANGKPLDKINSRGAPSSLVSKDKETRCGVSLGGVGGGGRTPTQHVTRGSPCTWQGSSRHRPHFPDQEPMKNSVPTCWRESRGPGPHLPALSPLPRPTPEGQCPSVWPARAELLAPHCGEVLAETPRKKAGYSVSLSPGRPVTARPCRRPSQPPAHCGSHHGTALPATAPNSGEGPATVCDQRSHSGH